jgi:hypothetical protein
MRGLQTHLQKGNGVKTDWAPSVIGKKTGFMGRIVRDMDTQNAEL